ncbi:MAG: GIY-YIG nuclease family protein [Bacteroidota bacterium]|nr:GIY-YIG nuclease family protein [Bacteroidota bacterium]
MSDCKNENWLCLHIVGSTSNLEQRIAQHNAAIFGGYTTLRRPVKLLWSQEFSEIRYAIEAERKIKKWTRAKKEALMRGDFETLHELSKSTKTKKKNHPSSPPLKRSRSG